jgi:hypothetical protein
MSSQHIHPIHFYNNALLIAPMDTSNTTLCLTIVDDNAQSPISPLSLASYRQHHNIVSHYSCGVVEDDATEPIPPLLPYCKRHSHGVHPPRISCVSSSSSSYSGRRSTNGNKKERRRKTIPSLSSSSRWNTSSHHEKNMNNVIPPPLCRWENLPEQETNTAMMQRKYHSSSSSSSSSSYHHHILLKPMSENYNEIRSHYYHDDIYQKTSQITTETHHRWYTLKSPDRAPRKPLHTVFQSTMDLLDEALHVPQYD